MKVLLLSLSLLQSKITPPLDLGYIAAHLNRNGHMCKILETCPKDIRFLDEVSLFSPDVVGCFVLPAHLTYVQAMMNLVKKTGNDITTVIGGIGADALSQQILMNPSTDVVCIEDGEDVFLEIAEGKDVRDISGIAYKQQERVIKNRCRVQMPDLDAYLSPYLENIFDMDKYLYGIIETSRGCLHRCIFCPNSSRPERKMRFHSIERIVCEMEYLVQHGVRRCDVLDPTFTLDEDRAIRLCNSIIRKGINRKLSIGVETRPDHVNPSMLALMKKAGVFTVCYGLESANQKTLDLIKKDIIVDKYLQAAEWTKKAGLKLAVTIIWGLPFETVEEVKKTIDFVALLKPDHLRINELAVFPGSELDKNQRQYGIETNFKIGHTLYWHPYSAQEYVGLMSYTVKKLPDSELSGLPVLLKEDPEKFDETLDSIERETRTILPGLYREIVRLNRKKTVEKQAKKTI